jgi:hypothetical protein
MVHYKISTSAQKKKVKRKGERNNHDTEKAIHILNVSGLNNQIKRQRLSDWIKKKIQLDVVCQRHIFNSVLFSWN